METRDPRNENTLTPVPLPDRIDRPALERIIQRAAELQANEREIGEGLSEADLMKLGQEVGIPAAYLRQALLEEQTRSVVSTEQGLGVWLAGPRTVAVQRTIRGARREVENQLAKWMTESELLRVKRRYPDYTSWEPQQGTMVALKRSLGIGGRQYTLSRTREVVGQVMRVDEERSHVRLTADLGDSYAGHLWGAGLVAGGGVLATGTLVALGFAELVAFVPAVAVLPVSGLIARTRLKKVERAQVALEQVLDRLEHGEIRVTTGIAGPRHSAFGRIADEIKKNLGI